MTFLIHLVSEERALGAGNVIRTEDGGTLLTNPGAMALWTLPFLFLGALQRTAAGTLVWLRSGWGSHSLNDSTSRNDSDSC